MTSAELTVRATSCRATVISSRKSSSKGWVLAVSFEPTCRLLTRTQVISSLSNLLRVETLPIIITVNHDRLAHLIEATPQSHPYSILQRLAFTPGPIIQVVAR